MVFETIAKLANEESNACVTISLNTHRTHPDNAKDRIAIKNLCSEARSRLLEKYDKKAIASLLEKFDKIQEEIDVYLNLDSLHLFLSNTTKEIIKSSWRTPSDKVFIAKRFNLRPLIKAYNRSEDYLIMVVSQGGVRLLTALNDIVTGEVNNGAFPFPATSLYVMDNKTKSDSRQVDTLVKEYLNRVDKALVAYHNQTGLQAVVIATEDNFSRLMEVAEKPKAYTADFANINYNNTADHHLVSQAWKIILEKQKSERREAVKEVNDAVSNGKVLTDLNEIYRAAREGRGDLLVTREDFTQPALFTGEDTFDVTKDADQPEAVDDIVSFIAWETLSKNGRVVFTRQDDLSSLGPIAMKVRY